MIQVLKIRTVTKKKQFTLAIEKQVEKTGVKQRQCLHSCGIINPGEAKSTSSFFQT